MLRPDLKKSYISFVFNYLINLRQANCSTWSKRARYPSILYTARRQHRLAKPLENPGARRSDRSKHPTDGNQCRVIAMLVVACARRIHVDLGKFGIGDSAIRDVGGKLFAEAERVVVL